MDNQFALIESKYVMEAHGWTINVANDNKKDPGKACGDDTFYGWVPGNDGNDGNISAQFAGFGSVKLSFENCCSKSQWMTDLL